ncbi:cytochrome c oxidase subunit 3 [Thioalkalivibrio thiocyanodenitrificans]|uniref:cytochrome c oxidase subunit 3 n=1 Tax=Thioalkalivibrio thiocyanodenitrificans TaxID=243063 RepID=UPI00035CF72D
MSEGDDMEHAQGGYYVPHGSKWPIIATVGLFLMVVGASMMFNGYAPGTWVLLTGVVVTLYMVFGWFGTVISESQAGLYNAQVDRSFRWGMGWFILSEVMFFAAFFGALFYVRMLALPWLGGEGTGLATHLFLWPDFEAAWPTGGPMELGGAFETIGAWGIPALNTAILLTSGVTITWAHWGLKENKRNHLIWGLAATVALGLIFLGFQAYEYGHAYRDLNLTLASGIYGSTFFMLTGFHGLHVTLGVIMLIVILIRSIKGHFTPHEHFGFEAVAWYWHFVDVVWLILFVFVYWI